MKDRPFLRAMQKRAPRGRKTIEFELTPDTMKVSEETILEIIDSTLISYPEIRKTSPEFKEETIIRVKDRIDMYKRRGKAFTLTELVNMIEFRACCEEIKILRKQQKKGE